MPSSRRRLTNRSKTTLIVTGLPVLYLRLLKGTRISTEYPSASMRPALYQTRSKPRSSWFAAYRLSIWMPSGLT
ncbi:MAG: hypothetical protein H6Q10_2412 [Acidobacteria bacterium]|nr:hypothetical protein [Acidobacteriota bacterium]